MRALETDKDAILASNAAVRVLFISLTVLYMWLFANMTRASSMHVIFSVHSQHFSIPPTLLNRRPLVYGRRTARRWRC